MERKIAIPISRRTQPGWLIHILLMLPFLLGTVNDFLGLPHGIRYLLDGAWLGLLIYLLRFHRSVDWRHIRSFGLLIASFFLITALVYPVQYQSGLYYLWGLRNNFRFYVAFLACAAFLTRADLDGYDALFDRVFWINAAVSAVQFVCFRLRGDHLGGIFGTVSGVNGDINIFFLIVLTRSLVRYLEQQESGALCAAKYLTAVVIAALAELKFFFVELVVLLCLAVLVTDFTWRKFWVILGGTMAVLAGVALLTASFSQYPGWFSAKWMLRAVTSRHGYTSAGDLNRLTAIPKINELWLPHWSQRIFGKGLGNCDTSSFAFLNTPFYINYGHMHYSWISYAFAYLETGWAGLCCYWGFFLLVAVKACRLGKYSPDADKTRCRTTMILAVFGLLLSVYNASLRAESAYMFYYALAAPFAAGKKQEKEESHDDLVLG